MRELLASYISSIADFVDIWASPMGPLFTLRGRVDGFLFVGWGDYERTYSRIFDTISRLSGGD